MIEEKLIKTVLPEAVVKTIYDDLLSPSAKELGKIGANVLKVAHLLFAPLQVLAAYQDRLTNMCARIAQRIPEDQQITPPAEVIGPALDRMRFLEEESPLWQMFEELISRSCDKEEVGKVHPAFVNIIQQLAPDEARILYLLRQESFEVIDLQDLNHKENRFENKRIEKSNLPLTDLLLPDRINLYYSHLESLSLVSWPVYKQEPIKDHNGRQIGIRRFSRMHLTEFGNLFVDACLPTAGFSHENKV